MQEIITTYDFVLLPVYLFIFYLVVRQKSKKYEKAGLRKIFIMAFLLRMVGAVGYGLLIQYYYGYGDSFGYYVGGNVISDMIHQDFSSVRYLFASAHEVVAAAKAMGLGDEIPESMPNDSNILVMKLSAVLSYFTFNKYLLISICFGFFSFVGIWKLFYVFYQLNEKKNVKLLAFFILYLPSLWFWGSGLLKEPVCIGAMGMLIYLFHRNFIEKKFSIRDMIVLLFMLFIITIVKSYITALLLISFSVILIYKAIGKIKPIVFRMIVVFSLLITIITLIITLDFSPYIKSFVESSFKQIQVFQKSYQSVQEMEEIGSKANFILSGINPSLESMIAKVPAVIGTCLFRPFVWESRKIIIFLASLEALLTFLITLFVIVKTRFLWFFKYIFTDAFLLFCFIFSILFALVIGYTTFNFGTLIRYKIIFLPFYFFLLIQVYTKYKDHHSV